MCSERHHICKMCQKEYDCNEADWICPSMNFDENANLCTDCEKEYHEIYLQISEKMSKK